MNDGACPAYGLPIGATCTDQRNSRDITKEKHNDDLIDKERKQRRPPGRCYFALWHGYGFLDDRYFKRVAKLKVPRREEYLVFCGPLNSIMSFYKHVGGRWVHVQTPLAIPSTSKKTHGWFDCFLISHEDN